MKRVALSVVFFLMAWGPHVQAQGTAECIQKNCQSPPPCEFMNELKLARAEMRGEGLMIGADAATADQVVTAFQNLIRQYGAECPKWESERAHWNAMSVSPVDPKCEMGVKDASGNVQTVGVPALKTLRNICPEIVEAEHYRQSIKYTDCNARRLGQAPNTPIDIRQGNQRAAYSKVRHLEASLRKYVMSCVPPADLARELSRLGLDALEKEPQDKYDKWWAQRALGGR